MKYYLLFAGDHYYPSGGIEDYIGDFDSVEEAVAFFKAGYYNEWDDAKKWHREWDWYQVVRSSDFTLVTNGRDW